MTDKEKLFLAIKKTIEELPISKLRDDLLDDFHIFNEKYNEYSYPQYLSFLLREFKHRIDFLIKRESIINQRKTDELIKRVRTIEMIMIAFASLSILAILTYLYLLM